MKILAINARPKNIICIAFTKSAMMCAPSTTRWRPPTCRLPFRPLKEQIVIQARKMQAK